MVVSQLQDTKVYLFPYFEAFEALENPTSFQFVYIF